MQINKILNNNAVITKDNDGKEIILMGRGLAYSKHVGDFIDENKANKRFVISSAQTRNRIVQLANEIPIEYIELSQKIVDMARVDLDIEIGDSCILLLMDHIHSSVMRYREGIEIVNTLQWEMKHFYPKEYQVGLKAKAMIEDYFGIKMKDDEAGLIAVHLVSTEVGEMIPNVYKTTEFINEVSNIVKYHFNIDLDENSLTYYRFITHLKFFSQRIFSQKKNSKGVLLGNDMLEVIKDKYVEPYLAALKVKQFIEKKYEYMLDDDEILYLTVHIARMTQ